MLLKIKIYICVVELISYIYKTRYIIVFGQSIKSLSPPIWRNNLYALNAF